MSLRFHCDLGVIEFADTVLDIFKRNRQTGFFSREAGGQLFCRFKKNAIVIERVTGPGSEDKRSRYAFWPNRKKEQREINELFAEGLHYIGDWHTHPEDNPVPSSEDIRKISDIFIQSDHYLPGMLLVVVGRRHGNGGLWVGVISALGVSQARETT